MRPNIITVIPAAVVSQITMTQNHILAAESIVTPNPTVVVTMEWGAIVIPDETWTEEPIATDDPWTQLAA